MANLFAPGSEFFFSPTGGVGCGTGGRESFWCWGGGDAGGRRGLGPFSVKMKFGVDVPGISDLGEGIGIWDGALVTHGRHDMALSGEDLVHYAKRRNGDQGLCLLGGHYWCQATKLCHRWVVIGTPRMRSWIRPEGQDWRACPGLATPACRKDFPHRET